MTSPLVTIMSPVINYQIVLVAMMVEIIDTEGSNVTIMNPVI